jgi:hypothetical protein
MSTELIVATLTAAMFGGFVLSLGLRRALARRHAARVEAGARGWLDAWERVPARGLMQLSVGGHWRQQAGDVRAEVVAYRALLGRDLVGWRPWLLVQVTGARAGTRTLAWASWPDPIWKVEPNWMASWQLGFARRAGLLGSLEQQELGEQGRALLASPGASLSETDRAALRELADARSLWVEDGRACAAWSGADARPSTALLEARLAALRQLVGVADG